MFKEIKAALIPLAITCIVSIVGTFFVTVNEVSANGEQGKRNGLEIKEIQTTMGAVREKQASMDGKLDLLIERAKLGK